jgi:chromosome segregation ATPase
MDDNTYMYAFTADPGKPMREAQEQINRLLKEIARLHKQSGTLADHVYRLRNEKQQLIVERDEARREVCEFCESGHGINSDEDARGIAAERGWDCYETTNTKENDNG